jgi:YidC/Oxa1 family membrane protein insertase
MNDIRRTILWVIFGFSMVLLWDKWQLHNGNKATFFPSSTRGDRSPPPCRHQRAPPRCLPASSVPSSTTRWRAGCAGACDVPAAAVPGQALRRA